MVRPLQMIDAPIHTAAAAAPHAVASDWRTAGLLAILAAGAVAFWFLPLGIAP